MHSPRSAGHDLSPRRVRMTAESGSLAVGNLGPGGHERGTVVSMSEAMVGERLRSIRRQKGLSLHDVEARSGMEFKASVLGAYERGERAISVPRLLRLAEIYQVPGDQLLPRISDVDVERTQHDATLEAGSTLPLGRRPDPAAPEASVLSRYPGTFQLQHQASTAGLPPLPRHDPRVLAAPPGRRAEGPGRRRDELGLRGDRARR